MNKNSLYRKGFVIGIMVLFVGASILPSISGDLSKERGIDILDVDRVSSISDGDKSRGTFYVGGSGAGNYSSIQSAIDAAISGDIVFVYNYSSPYYENIIIDKSINLIGEDRDATIIDGGGIGDVVYVSADWVNITGFTIQNSGSSSLDGGIKSESNFNCFSYNNILYNDCGIFQQL